MPLLDPQRERIQDDLRGLVAGEVRCDDVFLQLFASDASIHEIKPLGVVQPRNTNDVAACVRYAAEKRIPIHARGAGTGVAGESLGPGLIVDFSAHMRRIIRVDADRVCVQPGVVYERLNAQLREQGRVLGPDPAASEVTTIGSMLAVDACGSRWLKYGSIRQWVRDLLVVLADGQVLELGREPLVDGRSASTIPRKRDLINRLAALLTENAELIRRCQPQCPQNHGGYNLSDVLGDGYLDVARLLAGSEGTLAMTTEATLGTAALPQHRGAAILMFDSLDKAARAVPDVLACGPTACDLMDRRHLTLAREAEPRFEPLIPPETEAVLLIELDGDEPREVRRRLREMAGDLWQGKRIAFGARFAFEKEDLDLYGRLIDKARPTMYRVTGATRPPPIIENMTVAPGVLPDFVTRMQNVLKRNEATASLYCHAGQGQLRIQPFLDLANADDAARMRQLADDLYQEVFAVHGSIGGEHACGLSRTEFVRRQAGPLFDVFLEIKRIFDPDNILNPGKIVGDDVQLGTRHVRPSIPAATMKGEGATAAAARGQAVRFKRPGRRRRDDSDEGLRNLAEMQLNWDPSRVRDVVAACNRCGECRTQVPELRMCPIFRFAPMESATPRAKANLLRAMLTGSLDPKTLGCDEFKAVADLCVHCHSCRIECPAGVDIPRLMRESKAAYLAVNGLALGEWAMTRLDLLGAGNGLVAAAANWATTHRAARWLLEKTLGIAQGRKLPKVASRTFLRKAARRRLTRPSRRGGQKVLYFVDVYANCFDVELAEATVAVLEHNGVSVFVPPEQKQAGMAAIALGSIDYARKVAAHNIAILADAVRQGYHIVATEPAAALCLTHEYPQLIDDDDARLVAANSSDAGDFLWRMHTLGQLQLDFKPLNLVLGYHAPCHLRALKVGLPGENLLGLVPGLRLHRLEGGCSGMAGTFGLLHKNYRASLRAGLKLIARLRDPNIQAGVTECSACKLQMEQGTAKPTIHPVKLLALSYGLLPRIAGLLSMWTPKRAK